MQDGEIIIKNSLLKDSAVGDIQFRLPNSQDGLALQQLIAQCPPLDTNSTYCNLLQCHHFFDTCALAERDGKLLGFVSGYRLPSDPSVLFVWQLAVSPEARGEGLAIRLLQQQLSSAVQPPVRYLHTTINPDNKASWAVFERLAQHLDVESTRSLLFTRDSHFDGEHDDEVLLSIGPMPNLLAQNLAAMNNLGRVTASSELVDGE